MWSVLCCLFVRQFFFLAHFHYGLCVCEKENIEQLIKMVLKKNIPENFWVHSSTWWYIAGAFVLVRSNSKKRHSRRKASEWASKRQRERERMRTLLNALFDTQMYGSCVTLFFCLVFIPFSVLMLFDVCAFTVLMLTGIAAILRSYKQILQNVTFWWWTWMKILRQIEFQSKNLWQILTHLVFQWIIQLKMLQFRNQKLSEKKTVNWIGMC